MLRTWCLPVFATVLLHCTIIFLFVVNWSSRPNVVLNPPPKFVKAELITLDKPKAKPAPTPPPPKATPQKQPDQQKQEKARQEKLKQEKLQQEKKLQQAQTEKKAREQKLAEEKRQHEEQLVEEALKQAEEQERDRVLRESEDELAQLLAQEQAVQQSGQDEQLANSYTALISQAIQGQWSRPPSARNDMEVELELRLVPTGEVVNVQIVKSSGNSAFDRSAENAVRKVGRFPELQKLPNRVFEQYFRQFTLRFKPEDLRL